MAYNFQNKAVYNFDLHPAAVLGAEWKRCTVMGTITADIARTYADIDALHARVYPYLPTGSINSASGYDYVLVKTNAGSTTVIGLPWIIENSIEVVSQLSLTINLENIVSSDVEIIRQALIKNGYTNFKMSEH